MPANSGTRTTLPTTSRSAALGSTNARRPACSRASASAACPGSIPRRYGRSLAVRYSRPRCCLFRRLRRERTVDCVGHRAMLVVVQARAGHLLATLEKGSYLSRAFTMARRMERFVRPNPVADVPKRKVARRLPDYLRAHEVQPLLAALNPKWKPLFATALYTGMRKGELFALQKADVDFDAGLILVSRSHHPDIPKGGRVEAVPI